MIELNAAIEVPKADKNFDTRFAARAVPSDS